MFYTRAHPQCLCHCTRCGQTPRPCKICPQPCSFFLQEPVAAAIAHGLGHAHDEEPAILVVDIGGGTCDVTLLQSFEGILEVNAYDGDNCLGGIDLDFDIVRWWTANGRLPAGVLDCQTC